MPKQFALLAITLILTILAIQIYNLSKPKQVSIENKEITYFKIGKYDKCKIYPRDNLNTQMQQDTQTDRSKLMCFVNGNNQTIFEITDKENFETAKNSIVQVWVDNEGYKAMLVDQTGAGSGEGIGKVILIEDNGYKIKACFYYTYEDFNEMPTDISKMYLPPTAQQAASIKNYEIDTTDPNCTNFKFTKY